MTSHNFITICTTHDKAFQDVETEVEQVRSWAVELQIACEELQRKLDTLKLIGGAKRKNDAA